MFTWQPMPASHDCCLEMKSSKTHAVITADVAATYLPLTLPCNMYL